MKIKSISRSTFYLKVLFVMTGFTLGLSGYMNGDAQSVVGKWKRLFTTVYTTDKVSGKQVPVSADIQKKYQEAVAERGYKETLELKPDDTYISTVSSNEEKPTTHTGNYSVSGKILDMHIPLVSGEKTTITIRTLTGTTMEWDLVYMGKLTGITYTRL
jgi:lipocalin-like protein